MVEVCALADLADPGSRGFTLPDGRAAFVVRHGPLVRAYLNSCPHVRVELNWQPDDFLNWDRQLIQCSLHGAQFRIEDGLCLRGPCAGRRLAPVPVQVIEGMVVADG